jgi:hypothetical protein
MFTLISEDSPFPIDRKFLSTHLGILKTHYYQYWKELHDLLESGELASADGGQLLIHAHFNRALDAYKSLGDSYKLVVNTARASHRVNSVAEIQGAYQITQSQLSKFQALLEYIIQQEFDQDKSQRMWAKLSEAIDWVRAIGRLQFVGGGQYRWFGPSTFQSGKIGEGPRDTEGDMAECVESFNNAPSSRFMSRGEFECQHEPGVPVTGCTLSKDPVSPLNRQRYDKPTGEGPQARNLVSKSGSHAGVSDQKRGSLLC